MQGERRQVLEPEDLGWKVLELVRTEREVDEVRETTDSRRQLLELVLSKPETSQVVETKEGVREGVGSELVAGEIDIEGDGSCDGSAGRRRGSDRRTATERARRKGERWGFGRSREDARSRLHVTFEGPARECRDLANTREVGDAVGDPCELFVTVWAITGCLD